LTTVLLAVRLLRQRVPLPVDPGDPVAPNGDRPPRRHRGAAAAALVVGAVAAGWLALSWAGGDDRSKRSAATRSGATATVARQTLVDRETVDGTLGYSDTRSVVNRLDGAASDADGSDGDAGSDGSGSGGGSSAGSSTGGSGSSSPVSDPSSAGSGSGSATLTWLARAGSVVRRGGALYRVDDEAVVLMYGSTPAYRTLAEGIDDGPDVRELEENLASLGYDPGAVDEEYSSSTAAAVRAWQADVGLDETGKVALGRVVFLPGARRIGQRKATTGQVLSGGQEVLETTSTRRVVKVELDAGLQALARRGDSVEVTLPGDRRVRGRIARVGRVARAKDDSGGGDVGGGDSSGDQELVIDLSIVLRSRRGTGRLDQAPVTVGIARESRKNVLAVPVEALLAWRGGGYGVELAARRRIVPVETGVFAGGMVQVAGAGIRAGTRVVVPE